MRDLAVDSKSRSGVDAILGYLNFASGAYDAVFFSNLRDLFEWVIADAPAGQSQSWDTAVEILHRRVGELKGTAPAFRESTQVEAMLEVAGQAR